VLLIAGTAIMNRVLLGVLYFVILVYLFLGISIVSEIFMTSIEKITAQQKIVHIKDESGNTIRTRKVPVWNATVANLTLMALGSSAPEILLAVVETMTKMGQCPGELGASTIVGSAAFNLLVISGLSIYAVSEETDTDPERDDSVPLGVKKIYDMRVFTVTCIFSLFAYAWLIVVLKDQQVEPWEGWVTLSFFFLLIGFAYAADLQTAKQVAIEKAENGEGSDDDAPIVEFTALEIYRELLNEKKGEASKQHEEV
jgi:solute carrier family 8 (sodium/calcium exchanger)